ncbi:MAG: MFS transporter [Dongiaceae bacterium]
MASIETMNERDRWQSLAAVIGSAFAVGISVGAIIPLLSLALEQRGLDAFWIGINTAMFPLGVIAFGFLVPRILAKLGTFKAIVISLSLCALAILLFPMSDDYFAWCLIRLGIGAVGGVQWVASEAWINLMATDRNRSRVMAIYATVMAGGFVCGPLILGQTGIDGWLPYIAIAACNGLALIPILAVRQVVPDFHRDLTSSIAGIARSAPLIMLTAFVAGFVDAGLFALLPVYELRGGIDRETTVLTLSIFMAGNLLLQFPIGWIADHSNRRLVLLACALLIAIGALAFPLLLHDGAGFWILMFAWGGVSWGLYTLGLAMISDQVPVSQLAAANAAFVMAYEIGSMGGPVIAGAAMDYLERYGLPLAMALVALLLPIFGRRRRSLHPRRAN